MTTGPEPEKDEDEDEGDVEEIPGDKADD